ncbi:MAG: hypothetical protein GXX96_21055 [Planctomycetaceae bacterium]|nr:hypothetical protein [Planctomycetaceae bacterium]
MPRHRLQELNTKLNVFQKLGYSVILLVVGVLLALLFMVGVQLTQDPILRGVLTVLLDALVPFYILLILYIWWRPQWLSRLYSRAETKLVFVGDALVLLVFVLMIVLLVVLAVRAM